MKSNNSAWHELLLLILPQTLWMRVGEICASLLLISQGPVLLPHGWLRLQGGARTVLGMVIGQPVALSCSWAGSKGVKEAFYELDNIVSCSCVNTAQVPRRKQGRCGSCC
ncbi:uncharacterized protein LOC144179429 [Haemaphysalis longicornis]